MIYFLYGPDTYRSREKLKELVEKNSQGFNVQKIDGVVIPYMPRSFLVAVTLPLALS